MKKGSGPSWLFCAILFFAQSIITFISANVNQNLVLLVASVLALTAGIRCVCRYTKEKNQQDEE